MDSYITCMVLRLQHSFDSALTSQQALSCHHVSPCPRGSGWCMYYHPCAPTSMSSFPCFELLLACSQTAMFPFSYVTFAHLSQYQLWGGGRRSVRGNTKKNVAICSPCGAWSLAASGTDPSAVRRPFSCMHRWFPAQHEKGQLPLDALWQNDVSAAIYTEPAAGCW